MTKKIQKPESKPAERNSGSGTALATKPLTSPAKSPLQPLTSNKQPQQNNSSSTQLKSTQQPSSALSRKGTSTRIIIKYDVGFPNVLFIRGKGGNLSWEKGLPLRNVKPDEWIWESDAPFSLLEFKILINDREYESGNNHTLTHGSTIQFTPKFQR